MTQLIKKIKPLTVNTDTSRSALKETESTFLRGYEIAFTKDGENNEGGNFGMGKKIPSNYKTISLDLPKTGINKTIGFYEASELNEAYVFNWNSERQYGIYRLDGITLTSETVCIHPGLEFSIDPKHAIPEHRVTMRLIYGIDAAGERVVIEKIIIFTNGLGWQKWIPVIAAIATGGFDASRFPYYKLQGPQYDANEFIDYITRPPMFAPVINPVPTTAEDLGQPNKLFKNVLQFAYRAIMTDGRPTPLSWFSTPYFSQPSTCDVNNISEPRCLDLVLDAGSALVERYQILVRYLGVGNSNGLSVNTDWALYDTIDKFSTSGQNDPSIIGKKYWTRVNPWEKYNYNASDNTITYRFCGDKGTTIFSVDDALLVQNDVPLKSWALCNTGDVLLWGNNLRFYPNLPQSTLDNISTGIVDVTPNGNACTVKSVKITLYATFDGAVVSFKNGGPDTNRHFCRGIYDVASTGVSFPMSDVSFFSLNFGNNVPNDGFICYLAGTSYYSIGKQYKVDSSGVKTLLGVVDNSNGEQMKSINQLYATGGYVMQQFDFYVPAGNYVARLAGHGADLSENYQQTSTYVRGIAKRDTFLSKVDLLNWGKMDNSSDFTHVKEIRIDATAGNVDTWDTTKEMFLVFCPFKPLNKVHLKYFIFPFQSFEFDQSWRIIEGYLKDNVDGIGGVDSSSTIGVELVRYAAQYGKHAYRLDGGYTDANGFYFVYTADDDDLFNTGNLARSSEVFFGAKFNCGQFYPQAFRTQINQQKKSGYYPNQQIFLADINSSLGNFITVKGRVVNCITGNGISSVGVTPGQGQTYYTDGDGNFSIRIHTLNIEARKENIYVNGNGNCAFSNCDCSLLAVIPFDGTSVGCSSSPRIYPTEIALSLKVLSISGSSLKGGGSYPVGIVGHDLGGRKVAVGFLGNQYVPTFLEKGNFDPAKIQINVNGKLNLPNDIKWITFVLGANVNTTTYLQWVGDKIEFLDNVGNVTGDGNGAIRARITVQSLIDFNIRENFSTTANWKFLANDVVRIYDDGRGNLFDPAKNNGYLDYQVLGTDFNQTIDPTKTVTTTVSGSTTTTATTNDTYDPKSFIIPYDERLLALKDTCGFWIEVSRNIPAVDNEPFFGVSGTYPVKDGEIIPTSIVLDAFDTFYQKRNIIISGCSGGNINHPFESQSVTDYWGDNVTSAGIVLFKDPLAQQRWYLNDVIKTDAFVNNGRVNGLGTCRSVNRKDFTDQDWGGILAMHAERNMIGYISQNDWFTTDFQLNYAHVDQYGRVIANPDLATGIGNPYQKVGDNFGCEYEDISTIKFHDGIAVWADRKNSGFIIMNYRQAFDVSAADNKSYFTEKFKYLQRFNTSIGNDLYNIMETCVGINPNNGKIYITFRNRNGLKSSPVNFVNNEREKFYQLSETFVYDPRLKSWTGWMPFAPEYYGSMQHSQSGAEMITFANGVPWFHNSKNIKGFMNFYGVDTDQVVNSVSNFDPSKLKIYQAIAIECGEVKYFISKITTDDPSLISYLSLSFPVKRGNVLYSELLRNMNTYPDLQRPVVSMLQDGKSINGRLCEFQLVSDFNESDTYSELNNIQVQFIGSEKSNE